MSGPVYQAEPGYQLMLARVEQSNRRQVAQKLGVSRTAVSLILSGKYDADPARILALAVARYGQIDCPHLAKAISPAECHAFARADAPTHNPMKMRHWNACQRCPRRRESHA